LTCSLGFSQKLGARNSHASFPQKPLSTDIGAILLHLLGMSEFERHARDELVILEALLRAMDRRDEVFREIDASRNVDEAIRRVSQLLDVGAVGGRSVLDLQVRRFTQDQRHALATRAEELRSSLPDGR